jgi:hypothetical protein
VSLEGTLETIALPDVLALLSVTAKTGELRIESGGGVGSVWFDAGHVAGFDVGTHSTPVDALFALLRLREGQFKFHTGTAPVNAMPPQDVVPLLEEAESRLMQWPGIAAAIPSLYSELHLQDTVEGTVMLRPDQWQLVATIAGGRQVGTVLQMRQMGEFDGCKAIKELIDYHLVWVAAGVAPTAQPAPAAPPAPAHVPGLDAGGEGHDEDAGAGVYADVHGYADVQGYAAAHAAELPAEVPADAAAEVGAGDEPVSVAPDLSQPEDNGHWAPEGEPQDVADLSEVWNDETGQVEHQEAPPGAGSVAEPVNRGLLLKFLGSARN